MELFDNGRGFISRLADSEVDPLQCAWHSGALKCWVCEKPVEKNPSFITDIRVLEGFHPPGMIKGRAVCDTHAAPIKDAIDRLKQMRIDFNLGNPMDKKS